MLIRIYIRLYLLGGLKRYTIITSWGYYITKSLVCQMMHRLRRYDVFRFAQNDVAPLRSAMRRCLPPNVAKPRIIREANIIRRSPASFAAGKHHSKKELLVDKSSFFVYPSRRLGISSPREAWCISSRAASRPCISSRASVHFPAA